MSSVVTTDVIIVLLYALAAVTTISWLWGRQKDTVPALIGSNGFFLPSYKASYEFLHHAADIILEGYIKDREGVFRIPRFFQWDYVANGARRISELAAAPEDVLSFKEGVGETLQVPYMMGPEIEDDPYHHHTIRTTLTRNLGRCFPEVRDEIVCAFDDVFRLETEDWKIFTVFPAVMHVVARTSNRLFVGLPLCRNKEYLSLGITYTVAVFKRCHILRLFPKFLRPVVGPLMSPKEKARREALRFLGPLISERLAKQDELGPDWPDKPNDLVSWLIQDAGPDRTASSIAWRVVVTNMAAIHTSTIAFHHTLLDLAAHPSHIQPMREEVERVIRQDGWTKAALNNMHQVDSFIRESQRLNGSSALALNRKVLAKEGFRFSDGTVIPYGSMLSVSGQTVSHDPANFDHPEVFDGFRFSRMRGEQQGQEESIFKRHMITTAPEHLPFGHGKHACPGRFFAATELKAMLAHMLVTYDIKSDKDSDLKQAPQYSFGQARKLDPTAKIWVRKRQ
ncbi:cytochrome P450 [Mycena rosella]|uniref:Cytochrome P450 n=1 Tax=Mycena rosella TaxID=1033263 RepID=A0AAD7CHN6_MYCRO|nr:cytochrome P450 [Mycena rosella]